MKMQKVFALLLTLSLITACSKSDSERPSLEGASGHPVSEPSQVSEESEVVERQEYRLNITGLNFLDGRKEPCNVRNKIFIVSDSDEKKKIMICENSVIALYLISHQGVVHFKAKNTIMRNFLTPNPNFETEYILGETEGLIQFAVDNPFGFTFMNVEDVTDIKPETLKKIAEIKDELNLIKHNGLLKGLRKGYKGTPILTEDQIDRMIELEEELDELKSE